jgi:hypothetical protein
MDRTTHPVDARTTLAPSAHAPAAHAPATLGQPAPAAPARVQVTGPLHAVRFPDACARCGAAARGTLRVEKMFRRTYRDAPTTHLFAALEVPFCDACRAQHARELAPIDPAVLRRLRWTFVLRVLPYVLPVGVLLWMFPKALLPIARSLAEDGPGWGTLLGLGILAFFGASLLSLVALIGKARRDLVAPYQGDPNDVYIRRARVLFGQHAVIPGAPTSVLASANVTDDRAELFDPERRTFTFADPVFGAQFAALNADRLWDATAPRARRTRKLRRVLTIAIVVLGVVGLLLDWWRG